MLKYISQAA